METWTKKSTFLNIEGRCIPIATTKELYALPDGMQYRDLYPCTKHYNAYNCGYNSRNRMGRLLFSKIVREYLEMKGEELLDGKTISIGSQPAIMMVLLRRDARGIELQDKIDAVRLHSWTYDGRTLRNPMLIPMRKFKAAIALKIASGFIYPKKIVNANKHKILYGK